jgi:cytosine/adenosine deaminase-related metal-dependent hydrolase
MLDLDMIEASAKMAALESIKHGVTYEIDHHSSPNSSKDSLKTISDQLNGFNIRNVLCFETTDRNGAKLRDEGFSENINFRTKYSNHDSKSLLGLHASFTLDDGSLKKASDLVKEYDWGVHVHLCEDISDVTISKANYTLRPMQRFKKYDLLNEKSILAHGIHLNDEDFEMIGDTGAALVFNIDSNMNNSVGLQKYNKIPKSIPILVGTDGMHANTACSLKELFLQLRHSGFSFDDAFEFIVKTYLDQHKFIKKYFNDFTSLNENERADFIIWDYVPPTPIHKENFWGHYIYGILERPIKTVVQYGEIILDDFKLNRIDENSISNEIYSQGEILSRKFNKE